MDQERQIRFLIPPFVFILSLLWGAHLAGIDLRPLFGVDAIKSILGILAVGAVTAIAVGFIISTISVNILRVIFCLFKKPAYEATLTDETLRRIWLQIKTKLPFDRNLALFAASTFDHELFSDGIHYWLMRRWSSFNISFHCCVALALSDAIAPFLPISQSYFWGITSIVLGLFFLLNAICAWRETMHMLDFQSYRKQSGRGKIQD